ncbi:MAG: ATP-dependent DNA helicase RecG [Betaproteobacteria bacterium]|nr:ATP-dependent DNA helicase RecG [Betaproteobacteria bacterium]
MAGDNPGDAAAPPPAVSGALREKLSRLGLASWQDLILHLPLRYEDETHLFPIREAPGGRTVQVEGTIIQREVRPRPRPAFVLRVQDASGELWMRLFHFYPNQVAPLTVGRRIRLLGEVRAGLLGPEMIHPQHRIVDGDTPLAEALTPVYPTTAGVSQTRLRTLVKQALAAADLSDSLPEALRARFKLPPFARCLRHLHEPPPDADSAALESRRDPAWRRMKFDELLAQQLSMRMHYRERRAQRAPILAARGHLTQHLLARLPFSLTPAQLRVLHEIGADLGKPHPMQRLLQGDVGSGKTVVAALAALAAIENGAQAAVMAPTELLAEQHFAKLSAWMEPLGVRLAWLAAGLRKQERTQCLADLASGQAQLAVGTHALFQPEVEFHSLGLAIVDEQHRFGVHQRLALNRKGTQPHQLMMSATPIPRTLSMSYYADLDVSVIDELPPGRQPVATKLVADLRRDEVTARVRAACLAGRQAYWVCPLIEESEALQLKTATETFERLASAFPELRVGLVHGRLPAAEKAGVMAAFQQGALDLLVATTVIEVGVDVPNASLMVIEHAERMGLSQLHQLRGRVGRGSVESVCILLYASPLSEAARARLKIIYEHHDGFEIARQDLLLRGPGEYLGTRQSGTAWLRFADIEHDQDLLDAAREAADELLEGFPEAAQRHLDRWLPHRQDYLKV